MQAGHQLADGRYTLETLIQRSGMGEVWIARQHGGVGFSKQVVIKMISPALSDEDEAHQRFFDEARIASRINHPHVVQLYDFGQDTSGSFFLAMEYIAGHDLSAIVERAREKHSKVPFPIACRILADACQGLGYMHDLSDEQGRPLELVHRDISPSNLIVSNAGGVKIIDFGIAKAREKKSRTRTGVIVGKLQYMSPEQLSSSPVDLRSDIYSMGLVFYELLTLERRFRGNNLLEVYYEALHNPPPVVTDLRPNCPRELVTIVQKALSNDPSQRYGSAYELQEALESYLRKLGQTAAQRQISMFLTDLFSDSKPAPTFEESEETTQVHPMAGVAGFVGQTYQPEGTDVDLDSTFTSMTPMYGMDRDEERTDINVSPLSPRAVASAQISQESREALDHTFSGAMDDFLQGDSLAADNSGFDPMDLFRTNHGPPKPEAEEATRVLPVPSKPPSQQRRPQLHSLDIEPVPEPPRSPYGQVPRAPSRPQPPARSAQRPKAMLPDMTNPALLQPIDDDETQPPMKVPRHARPVAPSTTKRRPFGDTLQQPDYHKEPEPRVRKPSSPPSKPAAAPAPAPPAKKGFPWWILGFALLCVLTGAALVILFIMFRR